MKLRIDAFSGLRRTMGDQHISRDWSAVARRLNRPGNWQRAIVAVNIGLVVLTANFVADIVWIWAKPTSGHAAVEPALAPRTAGGGQNDYSTLLRFDPFHRATTAETAAPAETLKETTLDLKLFGIRVGSQGNSSAIVRTPDKRQAAFREGEDIMGGVVLRSILPNRVVIAHRGALESLYLDEDAAKRTVAAGSPASSHRDGTMKAGVDDADALMAAFKLEPRIDGRGVDGFVISPGKNKQLFTRLGFVAGDVLLAVNGTQLTDAKRVMEIKDQLHEAQSIRLEIERNGDKRIIELSQTE